MDPIEQVKKIDGAPSSKSMELQKHHLVTYLTTNGVVDWLTKICVDLNLKRPENREFTLRLSYSGSLLNCLILAIEYLQNSLGNLSTAAIESIRTATTDDKETRIKELECELAEARLEIEILKQALERRDVEKTVVELQEVKEIKVESVKPIVEEPPTVETVEIKAPPAPAEIAPTKTEEVAIVTEVTQSEKAPETPVADK